MEERRPALAEQRADAARAQVGERRARRALLAAARPRPARPRRAAPARRPGRRRSPAGRRPRTARPPTGCRTGARSAPRAGRRRAAAGRPGARSPRPGPCPGPISTASATARSESSISRSAGPPSGRVEPSSAARPSSVETKLKNTYGRSSGARSPNAASAQHVDRARPARPPAAGAQTQQPSMWSSTSPQACISAYAVVGPTNLKPRFLSSFAIAVDSGVVAGTSARVARPRPRVGRERPQQLGERHVERGAGVRDRGLDLGPVAHDRGVGHQPLHVLLAERGHDLGVEARERGPEALALAQDRDPGQPGLERLQAQLLVQRAVIAHRPAPLGVVVGDVLGRGRAPPAAGLPVVADHQCVAHAAAGYRLSPA